MYEITQQIRDAMASYDLHPPHIMIDGQIHRFSTNGRRSDRAGFYCFWDHRDGFVAGFFGDWRSGLYRTWHSKQGQRLNSAEAEHMREQIAGAKKEAEQERKRTAREAARQAWKMLENAKEASANNPYLKSKKVKPCAGLKELGKTLLVPVQDINKKIHGLQKIKPDGTKLFLLGTAVKCHFFRIKGNESRLYVCEGVATGLSIHQATGCQVFCCFNCGNLKPVAKAIRKQYPEHEIVVCADDDAWADGNPGLTHAREAACSINAKLAIPHFKDTTTKPTDFNDLHQLEGLEMVQEQVNNAKKPKKPGKKTTISWMDIARDFIEQSPLYYDRMKIWWEWNGKSWQRVDETDILGKVVLDYEMESALVRKIKDRIFEALKILARRNKPKDLPAHYLQLHDCLFDLKAGENLKPSRDFFITSTIPWRLGEQETTPTIDRLFADWVGDEQKAVLYEILAYCLLPSYPIHRMFILLGAGSNGKSTYIRLIKKFLGTQNCVSSELERLVGNIFEPARLYKKLVCFIGETNFHTLQRTSMLKQLTGEDPVSGQFKYKNAFEFTNYAKILIATNTLPQVQDKTDGFFRRTLIVHFPNQFKKNKNILAEIPDYEFENLVRKSIRILGDLLDRGRFFGEGSVSQKRQAYEDLSNPLKKFISEKCQDDPDGFTPSGEFYETFQAWLKDNKLRVWTNREIAKEMKELGYSYGRKRLKNKSQPRGWFGLVWAVPDVPEVPPPPNNFPNKGKSLKLVEFAAQVAQKRGAPKFSLDDDYETGEI